MGHIKHTEKILSSTILFFAINSLPLVATAQSTRQKISINKSWRFIKGDPPDANGISYDARPEVTDRNDNVVADTKPTESIAVASSEKVLKNWILPSANDLSMILQTSSASCRQSKLGLLVIAGWNW